MSAFHLTYLICRLANMKQPDILMYRKEALCSFRKSETFLKRCGSKKK